MSNTSKNESQPQDSTLSVEALRSRLGGLENSLKVLMEAINQVNDEIKALSFGLETVAPSNDAVPESVSIEEELVSEETEETVQPTTVLNPSEAFLEAVNTLPIPDLIDKLREGPAKQNVIKNIISERKKLKFQEFTSLDDVVARIKGLAQPSLDKILEHWS